MKRPGGFPVSREARARFGGDDGPATERGHLAVLDRAAVRRLTARMNAARDPGGAPAQAGEIVALGLLHEVFHLLVERYDREVRPAALADAATTVEQRLPGEGRRVFERFATAFPTGDGLTGDGPTEAPPSVLEELLLTRVANENPAAAPLRDLFDDRPIARSTRYDDAIAECERTFAAGPAFGPDGETLLELLRAPARHSPGSLAGQLRYIRDRWRSVLGDALDELIGRLDLALGLLAEEQRAWEMRGAFGGFSGRADAPSFAGAETEAERFSSDSDWMPRLVLMAKSTYVWLDQLSRSYGRDIRTLDAVPDEALDRLASWGVTGLWLIGLWERSRASEKIKRWRGNADAVASAYSLDDYRIADDLGGEAAYAALRDRAWTRGIRLASDMVPNHMGIDSRWVIEHPDWFLSLPEPPYPSYTFGGADLSDDGRAGVVLEDHYWDDSDAAVVFKRFDRATGDVRYVYHGNDGTSFPWNDTAQLDFLKPEVREAVIQTIIAVARRFPVIRFDAAMVLAKRHIQRLWWPEPGAAGIPSRAEHGSMTKAEFEARMPAEFWREVVDRVAAEVPDTLLLAEAFWMLEGYFVRTLGMHRVYNSAFMHMLRDEDNAGYRRLMKETLDFDPEILKRYVNFMNNPDEKTASEQFGKGDKYFGVATLLATLPGLPMLGHGQVEGFGEKYGMEFRRATLDERPEGWLVERHEREIFPLLHRRSRFAEARDFALYDLVTGSGAVDENVFAYSNGSGGDRSLVLYHNRYGSTAGHVRESVGVAVKGADGSKRIERRTLGDGLGLSGDADAFVAFRDARTGLEFLRSAAELRERGLFVTLDAYECHVFWEFRELRDGVAGQWSRLAALLGSRGVPSLDDALRELQLEPVHGPVRALFAGGLGSRLASRRAGEADLASLRERYETFLRAVAAATGVPTGSVTAVAELGLERVRRVAGAEAAVPSRAATASSAGAPTQPGQTDRADRATLLAVALLGPIGGLAPGADPYRTSRAWYEELRLAPVVAQGLRDVGLDEADAWAAADRIRVLLDLPRPSTLGGPAATLDGRLLDAWLGRDDLRAAIGLNTWEGTEWLDRDRFVGMLDWAERLDAFDGVASASREGRASVAGGVAQRLAAAAESAAYRVDRLRATVGLAGSGTGAASSRPRASKTAGPSGSAVRPVRTKRKNGPPA